MIIYNTTVKVANNIADEWLVWMKEEYIPDHMRTGLFIDCRLCYLLEQDEVEGPTYIVQYFADNMENYNSYMAEHETQLREKGYRRFGNQFIAFHTVMEVVL
jgi:hypothetical protein